jgi:hypothetical protein
MDTEPHPEKKRLLSLISRIALIFGIISLAFSISSSSLFSINWNIFPGDIIGPYPWIAHIGQGLSFGGFYGGLAGFVISIISLISDLFKKHHFVNIVASCLGLLMAFYALHTVLITLNRMREAQREISCYNLRDLGYRLEKYAVERDELLPHATNWCDALIKFNSYSLREMRKGWVKNDEGLSEFAFNANLSELKMAELPKDVVFLFETKLAKNPAGGAELMNPENHPLKGCFVLFGDMHVEFVRAEDFNNLRWKP